ncbi:MBL fold metallo-hydrolase [Bradyrhizobium sp. U87765 SZCCT0131]|uniref:MBL fold metallo-hydrolase n=1 Tax=unclassified Bradyrhizobium TaxID=2631580 RepID=UPI001BADA8DD|nr:MULTISPECIES: MBL fold metallo-hydrolase [unclassified Bradyrhizobium]MBR1222388.1 MBL fold metallo-hydrolase [Bradyrhizobium sp. U87765 SZCCT0131]MBR1264128.1 MBL fold metallo-hydrolase [Bradyrhizobium sp. U87765 SZCCT0134]MBR1308089.1 MBL fold metallo-hydrolase [Bradyrhizobium sp. U87765 SZCCT0110]MBR1320378.1 MBL fold metallo-hydrolase [Bradyrhizobium sp. U87765 SZCCT0109]MBR1348509.1 MBL fold metallo-hydrolase [Bradyrhizobium sp. U87765 SZCCT0048]
MADSFRVGDALITRIPELRWDDTDPAVLYPDLDAAALRDHGPSLSAGSYNRATGRLAQGTHSWLVRHAGLTILVDTATGNGKSLPAAPKLHDLRTPYLDHLRAVGVAPEQVDLVLISHIHADHVGWNTSWRDGAWVPTFPNARHLYSAIEARYGASNDGLAPAPDLPPAALGPPDHPPLPLVYRDSMQPVIAAGLGQAIVVDGSEVAEGLSFHPTPGHSIDHASIRLRSRGEEAWFMGDVLHHPLQVYRPDLRSGYCEFIAPAERSRRWLLAQAADSGGLCFSTHFAETSAGHVRRRDGGFTWQFAPSIEDAQR